MKTEQLKMIFGYMESMGETGKEVFIWWLAIDKALPVVGWLLTLVGIMWIADRIIMSINASSKIRTLRDLLGVGCRGRLTETELNDTLDKAIKIARNQSE